MCAGVLTETAWVERAAHAVLFVSVTTSSFHFSKEFREGGRILVQKLQKYQPRIAVFNGKCKIYF